MYNNGKDFIDYLALRNWDSSTGFRAHLIRWVNQIQNDLMGEFPIDFYQFQGKKVLTGAQEIMDLSPEIPTTPTAVIASGGSLTDGTSYKVYVTFVIYDQDLKRYVESEPSVASSVCLGTSVNKTISVTAIDVYGAETTIVPTTIYRNIYVAKKASTDTNYGEPLFSSQIANNTATTVSITSEPTSTVTPPSDSEVSQISSLQMFFKGSTANTYKYLTRFDQNKMRRSNTAGATTSSPQYFDFIGTRSIFMLPSLSTSLSDTQRTLSYYFYRRPHQIFYEVDRIIDIPYDAFDVLEAGVVWKSYSFRDRAGKESEQANYLDLKKKFQDRYRRQRQRPGSVTDVNGDEQGWEL